MSRFKQWKKVVEKNMKDDSLQELPVVPPVVRSMLTNITNRSTLHTLESISRLSRRSTIAHLYEIAVYVQV